MRKALFATLAGPVSEAIRLELRRQHRAILDERDAAVARAEALDIDVKRHQRARQDEVAASRTIEHENARLLEERKEIAAARQSEREIASATIEKQKRRISALEQQLADFERFNDAVDDDAVSPHRDARQRGFENANRAPPPPPPKPTTRPASTVRVDDVKHALAVPCPTCGVKAREKCKGVQAPHPDRFAVGREKFRLLAAALQSPCPKCGALVGLPCVNADGTKGLHQERADLVSPNGETP